MDSVFPWICYGTCMEKCAVHEMLTFHGQAHLNFPWILYKIGIKIEAYFMDKKTSSEWYIHTLAIVKNKIHQVNTYTASTR